MVCECGFVSHMGNVDGYHWPVCVCDGERWFRLSLFRLSLIRYNNPGNWVNLGVCGLFV